MKSFFLAATLAISPLASYAAKCSILLDSSVPKTRNYSENLFPALTSAEVTRDSSVKTKLGLKMVTHKLDTGRLDVFGKPVFKQEYNVQLFKSGSLLRETGLVFEKELALAEMEAIIESLPLGCR